MLLAVAGIVNAARDDEDQRATTAATTSSTNARRDGANTHCPQCGIRWVGGKFLVGWDNTVDIPQRLYVCRGCDAAVYPSSS